jgi:6-phosphogluconolactonase (cycloisomerase 2 family)
MKFKKFGKALLLSALSAGVVFSVSSCVQSYSVGFLYVTGTTTAAPNGNGIVSGFKIDHNTGKLTSIPGLPISTGGANPVRAVLMNSSRFLYVLNKGVATTAGTGDCTTSDPCKNSNITQFAVGGNGVLSQQETFYPQGKNPFRMITDSGGNFVMILDHDAPDSNALTGKSLASNSCSLALGKGVTSCGAIEIYSMNESTGRLSLVLNSQVSSSSGTALPYFPVPSNPIDFIQTSSSAITLYGTPATGDYTFPYTYSTATGQLTINQNTSQTIGVSNATAIDFTGGYVYILANDSLTYTDSNGNTKTAPSQILTYTVGTAGALTPLTGGAKPDDPTQSNPVQIIQESKNSWAYVANAGIDTSFTQNGIAGFTLDSNTKELTFMSGEPFGAGSSPACILEDPSNQFIYTANFNDSSVTGHSIDQNNGAFKTATKTVLLDGPATWCLVSGRTS